MWAVELTAAVITTVAGILWAGRQQPGEPAISRLVAVSLIVCSAMYAVSTLQAQLPVVRSMSHAVDQRAPGDMTVTIVGAKVRDCRYVGSRAWGVSANGLIYEAKLTFPGDLTPGSNRPVGQQHFGQWRLQWPPDAEPVTEAWVEVEHDCGRFLRNVLTPIGPLLAPAIR